MLITQYYCTIFSNCMLEHRRPHFRSLNRGHTECDLKYEDIIVENIICKYFFRGDVISFARLLLSNQIVNQVDDSISCIKNFSSLRCCLANWVFIKHKASAMINIVQIKKASQNYTTDIVRCNIRVCFNKISGALIGQVMF